MKNLIPFLLLLVAETAWSGHEVGNGGDAVVCRNPNQTLKSVEFFDIYEARLLRGIVPQWGASPSSVDGKIQWGLSSLERQSPNRAQRYWKHFKSFFVESRFLRDVQLIDIEDSGHIFVPVGCSIEQLVVQIKPRFKEDPRYIVNQDHWDMMNEDSRAAMILHEIIYREALERRHENSKAVRYYNSLIFSGKILNYSGAEYFDLMKKLRLPKDVIGE